MEKDTQYSYMKSIRFNLIDDKEKNLLKKVNGNESEQEEGIKEIAETFFDREQFVKVKCPACNGEIFQPAFEKFGFQYVICDACGSLYTSPRPTYQMLEEYYQMSNSKKYKNLNEEQREAVDAIDGPVMVVAGPGTGKKHQCQAVGLRDHPCQIAKPLDVKNPGGEGLSVSEVFHARLPRDVRIRINTATWTKALARPRQTLRHKRNLHAACRTKNR